MKIKSIAVQGFRGFNDLRTLDLHERLTLIYAPNSLGKTSLTEAVEWLLYGSTERVAKARLDGFGSEFKGSYQNCHYDREEPPFVQIVLHSGSNEITLRAELIGDQLDNRTMNGHAVGVWPMDEDLSSRPKPFVLQHALKDLLLAKPKERFNRFAGILGLSELDKIQSDFIAFRTGAYDAIPAKVEHFRRYLEGMLVKAEEYKSLGKIKKLLEKQQLDAAHDALVQAARNHLLQNVDEAFVFIELENERKRVIAEVWPGNITLLSFEPSNEADLQEIESRIEHQYLSKDFAVKYADLGKLALLDHLLKRKQFFDIGTQLLDEQPGKCPFCGLPVESRIHSHIQTEHQNLVHELGSSQDLQAVRDVLRTEIADLGNSLNKHFSEHHRRVSNLLSPDNDFQKLADIWEPKPSPVLDKLLEAIQQIQNATEQFETAFRELSQALSNLESSVEDNRVDTTNYGFFADCLNNYINHGRLMRTLVNAKASDIGLARQDLERLLEDIANTQELTLILQLHDRWNDLRKYAEIHHIITSLNDLRKIVEQYVSDKIASRVANELTSDVQNWYDFVRTEGDPKVHFDGFAVPRNRDGSIKARNIDIKAKSYDVELPSAISTLSESKLNALGLCMSIAHNLREAPFDFLFIDDPIQSWDQEHEIRFIQVVRELIERGKQIILLSHNQQWIRQVRTICWDINGSYIEFTGYTQAGPQIALLSWRTVDQRLNDIKSIMNNQAASSTDLQRGEEEVRLAVVELACRIFEKHFGQTKNPKDLDAADVRDMLQRCGVDIQLVNKIHSAFITVDSAHHTARDYTPSRVRLQQYYSWVKELSRAAE